MPALAEPPPAAPPGLTLDDFCERFGPIPASRIVTAPAPGTATVKDWECANRCGGGLYELIDGTLIRKTMSDLSSWLGLELGALLRNFAKKNRLG